MRETTSGWSGHPWVRLPGSHRPRALDIAQLAERLTVVDVLLLDASDCYQLVTGSIPVVETRVLPPDLLQSGAHD